MCKKLHKEDRAVAFNFIDYVRLEKCRPVNVKLEVLARHLAQHIKVNPEQSNARLANAIAKKFEAGVIA